jgi:hypothetical protein
MRRMPRCALPLFLPLAVVAGCNKPALVPVEGRVLLEGQPVPAVVVTFSPVGETLGNGAHGYTEADGRFTLSNVRGGTGPHVGSYLVSLVPSASNRKEGDPLDVIGQAGGPPRIAAIYMNSSESQLRATIPEGGGFIEILLTKSGQGATTRLVEKQ